MRVGLFFDCDGVLLDSNHIKTRAFREVARAWDPDAADRLVAYHVEHGGISRYEKFRYFFEHLHPVDDVESAYQEALDAFAVATLRGLVACDVVPGVKEFLSAASERDVPGWVVSGGAENEVRSVLDEKGLSRFFVGVHGSPATKSDIVRSVHAEHGIAERSFFFGDSRSDWETASAFGMGFIYVSDYAEWSGPPEGDGTTVRRIPDFTHLEGGFLDE